ncbi:hypothetical protein JOB18_043193 [Solea senegalensis]|uniref:Uncharacterized protein n=1 Tax=Solea senegalensis TaxID=28829 RepID=A0AAV6PUC7_SOLSE|nr:hypothetical protein JOB18_043193 [Solea senegalensis]
MWLCTTAVRCQTRPPRATGLKGGKETRVRRPGKRDWEAHGKHGSLGRRYRSEGRSVMLCGSAAGGARAAEAADTAAFTSLTLDLHKPPLSPPHLTPLTQSLPVSFNRWIPSSSALPNMDAPPPPPPPPPPSSSSAESKGYFFLAQ